MNLLLYPPELKLGISSQEFVGPQQNAVRAIAEIAEMRGCLHLGANLVNGRLAHKEPSLRISDDDFQQELLCAKDVCERFAIFANNPRASSFDLAFVDNRGHWHKNKIDQTESAIKMIAEDVYWNDATSGYLTADSPASCRRIFIEPGIVEERGRVALRRKRNLFFARPKYIQLYDNGTDQLVDRWQQISIDKISEFSLDQDVLAQVAPEAFFEVKNIIESGAIDELKNPQSLADIEDSIRARFSELISPAATIYYVGQRNFTKEQMDKRLALAKCALTE